MLLIVFKSRTVCVDVVAFSVLLLKPLDFSDNHGRSIVEAMEKRAGKSWEGAQAILTRE